MLTISIACGNCLKKPALKNNCTYIQHGPSGLPHRRSLGFDVPRTASQAQESLSDPNSRYLYPDQELNHAHTPVRPGQSASTELSRPAAMSEPSPANRSTGGNSGGSRPPVSNISPSVIDSMTAVVDEGGRTREYFGRSSAGSFTAQIRKAIEAKASDNNPYFSRKDDSAPTQRLRASPISAPVFNDAHRVLPTRRQADQLLSVYWKYVDPLYPFLDRQRWEMAYRAIFDGSTIDVEEHTFLATLNVIFALSSQLLESQTADQRDESSNVYFDRAQALLPLNTWNESSLELVQYLLLTSQYLQSTDRPHQTWMTVGSAVRIAQGLGLHLRETSANHPDVDERELLRRIWYGCILMDR